MFGHAGNRRQSLRIVIGQSLKNRRDQIRIRRRRGKCWIKSLRQTCLDPAETLVTRNNDAAVISFVSLPVKQAVGAMLRRAAEGQLKGILSGGEAVQLHSDELDNLPARQFLQLRKNLRCPSARGFEPCGSINQIVGKFTLFFLWHLRIDSLQCLGFRKSVADYKSLQLNFWMAMYHDQLIESFVATGLDH